MTLQNLFKKLEDYKAYFIYDENHVQTFDRITFTGDDRVILHSTDDVSDSIYLNLSAEIEDGGVFDDTYNFQVSDTKGIEHDFYLQVRICPPELM